MIDCSISRYYIYIQYFYRVRTSVSCGVYVLSEQKSTFFLVCLCVGSPICAVPILPNNASLARLCTTLSLCRALCWNHWPCVKVCKASMFVTLTTVPLTVYSGLLSLESTTPTQKPNVHTNQYTHGSFYIYIINVLLGLVDSSVVLFLFVTICVACQLAINILAHYNFILIVCTNMARIW